MNIYWKLTVDTDDEVRKEVCRAFVMILEVRPDVILPQIENVVNFMVYCTKSDDPIVAVEACEFWLTFADEDGLKDVMTHSPIFTKVLLSFLASCFTCASRMYGLL